MERRTMRRKTIILGLETSCDETAAALVADGSEVLSNLVSSQVKLHSRFGGVVPEIASRHHLLMINGLIDDAFREAVLSFKDLSAIAVTHGPGLVGALLIGVSTAKALSYALRVPLIAVNHLEAHLYANYLCGAPREYPAVVLIVSGGHTELLLLEGPDSSTLLGRTRDDAAGEAFDKVARYLELGYPGGPLIDKIAVGGDPQAIDFPRAWLTDNGKNKNYDFSFSGLKTAVINYIYHARRRGEDLVIPDLLASFQEALVEVLVEKTIAAALEYNAATVMVAGGVAANSRLRLKMRQALDNRLPNIKFFQPSMDLCTDNAAMIAAAAYPLYCKKEFAALNLNANPGLSIYCDRL